MIDKFDMVYMWAFLTVSEKKKKCSSKQMMVGIYRKSQKCVFTVWFK